MNTKKLVFFTGAAGVVAAAWYMCSALSTPRQPRREGAIGQRQVYRQDQAKDAAVNPGDAPVAAKAEVQQVRPDNDKAVKLAHRTTTRL